MNTTTSKDKWHKIEPMDSFVRHELQQFARWFKSPEYQIMQEEQMIKEHQENIRCLKLQLRTKRGE